MKPRTNQTYWDATSDEYQATHGDVLTKTALAWGVWRIPESELGILGDVKNVRVLELGCGAAQWTLALRQNGARAVGVDLSERQLHHARRASKVIPLVQGNAEALPFQNDSFDLVFCDHGATTFSRPQRTVAEAARVLRPNGRFAFCMSTPILDMCWDSATDTISPTLSSDYFSLSSLDDGKAVSYQLPYGAWIRLFREHSLIVDDLVELRPPEHASTTYSVPEDWARRWPAEHIWKLTKR
jgi:Methylase involved in ubiquinone/menaquinone biosynthesis